jgi:hypothetical protein
MYKPDRPQGVTFLAVLTFLSGVIILASGVASLAGMTATQIAVFSVFGTTVGSAPLLITIGLFALVLGWGTWSGKWWAWVLSVASSLVGVASSAYQVLFVSLFSAAELLVTLYILWYLRKPHVRAFYGHGATAPPTQPPGSR